MSIIHSALKKAESEKQKKIEPYAISVDEIIALAEKGVPAVKPSSSPKPSNSKSRSPILWTVSLTGAILLVVFSWFLISSTARTLQSFRKAPLTKKTVVPPASTIGKIVNPPPQKPAAKPVHPLFFTANARDFHLNGIVSTGGKSSAMINDQLVDIGDMVGDAKVVSITEKTVILERGGKNIVVHLD